MDTVKNSFCKGGNSLLENSSAKQQKEKKIENSRDHEKNMKLDVKF